MAEPDFRSAPFRISPAILSRLAIEEYLSRFWWFVAVIPVFGIALLTLPWFEILRPLGWFALAWPLTIPARSFFATRRARGIYRGELVVEGREDSLFLVRPDGGGTVVRPESVRGVKERGGYVLFRIRNGFLPVPLDAFKGESAGAFRAFRERRAR